MTSTLSIAEGSIDLMSLAPFLSGVDCGIPSISTKTCRPLKVCPELEVCPELGPKLGTVYCKILEMSELTVNCD